MSHIKSSSIKSNFSQSTDINQIHPDLRAAYAKIMYHIQHQLFFDPDLNHRQRMFVLYQGGAIENEFLRYIRDYICTLNIPEDTRDALLRNHSELSANLIPVDMYSAANHYYFVIDDSDDDTYVESLSDIDSNENDTDDDSENILLDRIAMEYDVATFHATEEQPNDNNHQDNPYN